MEVIVSFRLHARSNVRSRVPLHHFDRFHGTQSFFYNLNNLISHFYNLNNLIRLFYNLNNLIRYFYNLNNLIRTTVTSRNLSFLSMVTSRNLSLFVIILISILIRRVGGLSSHITIRSGQPKGSQRSPFPNR